MFYDKSYALKNSLYQLVNGKITPFIDMKKAYQLDYQISNGSYTCYQGIEIGAYAKFFHLKSCIYPKRFKLDSKYFFTVKFTIEKEKINMNEIMPISMTLKIKDNVNNKEK